MSVKLILSKFVDAKILEEPFSFLATNKKKLERFHKKYQGCRCFILGNGPSLNKIDLSLLNNEYTFAVNGIFYKTNECGFRPTFYVVEDKHVMQDNLAEIRSYRPKSEGARFFSSRYRLLSAKWGSETFFLNLNRSFYDENSLYYEVPRFSVDAANNIFCGQSVTIVNLQLAYYMGFSEVYLLGMDFSYKIPDTVKVEGDVLESTEEDPNHFHPDYFGKGKKWHDPKLHNVLNSYRLAKLMFQMDGRVIINATVGGALEVFPRVNLDDLLDTSTLRYRNKE